MPHRSRWGRSLCRLESRLNPAVSAVPDELVVAVRAERGPGEYPVELSPVASVEQLLHLESAGETLYHVRLVPGLDLDATRAAFAEHPAVAWADFNHAFVGDPREFTPNDPQYGDQYHHPLMQNNLAWDKTFGEGVTVAVTDDGVDIGHEDLAANTWVNVGETPGNGIDDDGNGYIDDVNGWDFSAGDNDAIPPSGQNHGTHVAGIIAARADNATGVTGTAGKSTVMPVRFYGSGSWTSTVILNSYKYAADNGAKIISTSYNIDGFVNDNTFRSAVQYAYDKGVLHLNSAGNNSQLNPPRQVFDQMLFVASTDSADERSSFSNYGTGIDISAPGSNILATYPDNDYASISGTSMATPNAAAAAALIWSANPSWTREQVVARLVGLADDIDGNNPTVAGLLGGGRANPYQAIVAPLPAPRIGGLDEVPVNNALLFTPPAALTVRLPDKLSAASVTTAKNWSLVRAGADDVFGTADDATVALTPSYSTQSPTFQVGSNQIRFTVSALVPGRYRFTGVSGGLVDPFGTALDGDGNGTAGGDFVRDFIISGAGKAVSHTPTGTTTAPVSKVTVNFASAMDTNSFNVADDVVSFTGPNGNLLNQITSFTWTNNKTLQISFNEVGTVGGYSMILGPNILSSLGLPCDNDGDGIGGETTQDRYTVTFTLPTSPSLRYVAQEHTYDAGLNLAPGAANVVTLESLSSVDDVFQSIPMGANTFRFYFNSYTGSSKLYVSSNGLITLGGGTTSWTNGNLTSSPSQATLAAYWDDLITSKNATPDDLVLYQFRDSDGNGSTDQLVVEWNETRHVSATGSGATFQAILQLNTGTTPGDIIYNYRDLDFGNSSFNNGKSASVGIKDSGTQGTNRLLVSQNTNANPLVQAGKAIRISPVLNTIPVALPGGPYGVGQNKTVALSGSAIDPDEPTNFLLYRWDLDGDGNFGETGASALRGAELGPNVTFNATGLAVGKYPVALKVRDSTGAEVSAASSVEVVGAPTVTQLTVNGGAAQRSSVTELAVTFSHAVAFSGDPASAFTLTRSGPGGGGTALPITVTLTGPSTAATAAKLTFAPLVDGNYSLAMNSSVVSGTVSGLPLVAYTSPAAPLAGSIFRLYGDTDGNRSVGFDDFLAFRSTFGLGQADAGYLAYLDADGDQTITLADFLEFRARFGTTLGGD